MNLQVLFGNPIKGKKKGKTMAKKKATAKKKPTVRKARKTSRKNPQDFLSIRGIDKIHTRIPTMSELSNMRKTIADAQRNKAGKEVIKDLQAQYIEAKNKAKEALRSRPTAMKYRYNKFKT